MKELFYKTIKTIETIAIKIINSQRAVPFVTAAISIKLLSDILNSKNLQGTRFSIAIISVLIMFTFSIITYAYLSKIEKDKDTEILDMTKRIVEAVYKHFGVAMANKDATATAGAMNPIMQTIVNLVKEFQKLAEKSYKD